MTWFEVGVAALCVLAVTVVPGFFSALLLGLRGLAAWATAGPFGLTGIALASVVSGWWDVEWSLIPCLLVWAVLAGVAFLLGLIRRGSVRRSTAPPRQTVALVLGLIVAAALIAWRVGELFRGPENISQTFDSVFHLNAVRYALDTGSASPFDIGTMTSPDGSLWFYPSLWHALTALTVQLTGASVPGAVLAVALAGSAVIWPAGIVLLTRVLLGRRRIVVLGASVLAAGMTAFPLMMLDYGVLYPNWLSLCILPVVLALVVRGLGIGTGAPEPSTPALLGALAALPALALAHPGGLVAFLVLSGLAGVVATVRYVMRRPGPRRVAWAVAGLVLYAGVSVVLARFLRPPADARGWPTRQTPGQALGETVLLALSTRPSMIIAAVLAVAGLVACLRARTSAATVIALNAVVLGGLYMTATSMPWPVLRDVLTGSWYNNEPRLAALIPIAVVPLGSAGAAWIWDAVRAPLGRLAHRATGAGAARRALGIVGVVALGLAVIAGTQGRAMRSAVDNALTFPWPAYELSDESPLLSTDELALLERLPDLVGPEDVIAGSPWTGTSLAYALADRRVLMPHILMVETADIVTINEGLRDAEPGSATCDALAETGVRFVLDFGDREVHGAQHPYPGLVDLSGSGAVTEVDRVGDAVLYRVVACD